MGAKLYVGNMSFDTENSDLETLFAAHGSVRSAQIIMDRDSGRSKGFGFVEMSAESEATAAILALNGQDFKGRPLTVNVAKPREDRGGDRTFGGGGGRSRY
jgi:RNA recognition motif-containing protein